MYKLLLFFILLYNHTFSQDTLKTFKLVSGTKTKTIKFDRFLTIVTNDSCSLSGSFLFCLDKQIFLTPYVKTNNDKPSTIFEEHNTYQIPTTIKNIDKIVYDRSTLTTLTGCTFWASTISAFIVSPLVSLKKSGGFNKDRFFTISGISLGTAMISAGVFIVFGEKVFYIKPIDKKRTWTIE